MSVFRRLLRYAFLYKRAFALSLILLTLAVAADLTGPFLAKRLIDDHVLGIERPWYQVSASEGTVPYQGQHYERADRIAGEPDGAQVRIVQVERRFVFVDQPLSDDQGRAVDGQRSYADGTLTITTQDQTYRFTAQQLSASEVFSFYTPELKGVTWILIFYGALLLIASVFQYGQIYTLQVSANRVVQRIRQDAYRQIHRLPVQYFDHMPAGKVVSQVTNDTESIRDLFVRVLANFFSGIIYMGGVFVALFLLDARLAMICLLLIPLLVIWVIVYRKFATIYNRMIRQRLSDLNGMINETIQGIPIIRAFVRNRQTEEKFETINEEYLRYQNKMLHLNSLTSHNLVGVLRNLSMAVLIWYFWGQSLDVHAAVSFGVLYAFVDYLNRLFQPVIGIVNQLSQFDLALVSAERVFRLMDEEGEDVNRGQLPRYRGNIKFDHVQFGYDAENPVLKQISFDAPQGQTLALVGHTGSGKSSIMNLLFRFYDPQSGHITIDGMNTREIPKQQLRQHMGIVLQEPFLFSGTIASNVSLNDPSITREQIQDALWQVGAPQAFVNWPDILDEVVNEKGSTLSAGQRQLISFARALVFNPAILILDEATASIDTQTESLIQQALAVLKQGRTTLVIAHRLSTIKEANQILVLHHGEIVERGDHAELMKIDGHYAQMYQMQQGHGALNTSSV